MYILINLVFVNQPKFHLTIIEGEAPCGKPRGILQRICKKALLHFYTHHQLIFVNSADILINKIQRCLRDEYMTK
jgi:hypothetical protein